jgi:hypothetical protein
MEKVALLRALLFIFFSEDEIRGTRSIMREIRNGTKSCGWKA